HTPPPSLPFPSFPLALALTPLRASHRSLDPLPSALPGPPRRNTQVSYRVTIPVPRDNPVIVKGGSLTNDHWLLSRPKTPLSCDLRRHYAASGRWYGLAVAVAYIQSLIAGTRDHRQGASNQAGAFER
ncbi:hypothetical protein BKA65DRAFT_603958, partial [Rhexocercosporidium sp. MPI-PUGE-AT-0058]